jgi:hypothetical protein
MASGGGPDVLVNFTLPAAAFAQSTVGVSFARSLVVSIVKRQAYPENLCRKRAVAGCACLCSNTLAMIMIRTRGWRVLMILARRNPERNTEKIAERNVKGRVFQWRTRDSE